MGMVRSLSMMINNNELKSRFIKDNVVEIPEQSNPTTSYVTSNTKSVVTIPEVSVPTSTVES